MLFEYRTLSSNNKLYQNIVIKVLYKINIHTFVSIEISEKLFSIKYILHKHIHIHSIQKFSSQHIAEKYCQLLLLLFSFLFVAAASAYAILFNMEINTG